MNRITFITLITLFAFNALSSCKIMGKGKQKTDTVSAVSKLNGNWELNYISGIRIAFNGLYPETKPSLNFNVATDELNGNTSCNVFGSKTKIGGNKITIAEPCAMTMRFCEGEGEKHFLEMLKKITSYDVNHNTLTLIQGDIAVMRFTKK